MSNKYQCWFIKITTINVNGAIAILGKDLSYFIIIVECAFKLY